MANDTKRLAVLIDADNASPSSAAELFAEIAKYGTPTVRRAYGDWTTRQLDGWKKELRRHAIQPMQQFAIVAGKNATDSSMIIDAMDVLYADNVDGFVIVSSDSDYTRLATRLREAGKTVYGSAAAMRARSTSTPSTASSSTTCWGPSPRSASRRATSRSCCEPRSPAPRRSTAGRCSRRSGRT